jgi:hypothetical protein
MKSRKRRDKIFRVDVFVWGCFLPDLPSVRRAWWWRNKEQLLALRKVQVLIYRIDWSFLAKVDAYSLVHNVLTIEQLADANGVVGGVEGDNDAPQGFEWRPRVDWGRLIDKVADCEEVGRVEDLRVDEVLQRLSAGQGTCRERERAAYGYEEGVGRRRGLDERRKRREVQCGRRSPSGCRSSNLLDLDRFHFCAHGCVWCGRWGELCCLCPGIGGLQEQMYFARWRLRGQRGVAAFL